MRTGLLILNYNSAGLSAALAEKAAGFCCIERILVVDNCSTDHSMEELYKRCTDSKIQIVRSEKNGGYAYGNNFGAKLFFEAGIEILFIANPDVDIEEADLKLILTAFEKGGYAVLTGVEYDGSGKISVPPVWAQMRYRDDLLECFYFGRTFLKRRKPIPLNYNVSVQAVELVKGSFFAVRLKDFMDVGGFDENTFLFCEERILGKRMQTAGKKLGIVPAARYYHNHSTTIDQQYRRRAQKIRMLYESRLYYHKTYTRIGPVKRFFLTVAMKFSLLEYQLVDRFIQWRRS